jgi:hypothetical protein
MVRQMLRRMLRFQMLKKGAKSTMLRVLWFSKGRYCILHAPLGRFLTVLVIWLGALIGRKHGTMSAAPTPVSRRAAIKAIRRLSRFQPMRDDYRALTAGQIDEHDRTFAMVAGSRLEDVVAYAIRQRFRTLTPSENDALFLGVAPLATFSAKIKIAYSLSIYGPRTRDDLDIVREIRNTKCVCSCQKTNRFQHKRDFIVPQDAEHFR